MLPSVIKPDVSTYLYRGLGCPLLFLSRAQPTVGAAPLLGCSSKGSIYSCVVECVVPLLGKREGRLSLQGFQLRGARVSGFSSPRQMSSALHGSAPWLPWPESYRVSRSTISPPSPGNLLLRWSREEKEWSPLWKGK